MAKKLTEKQEMFCQNYINNGGNGAAAYRQAYDAENMAVPTINNKAYELLKRGDIRGRLDEIRKDAIAHFEIHREDILKRLINNLNNAEADNKLDEVRQTAQAINKMQGWDKAKENDTTVVLTINQILDEIDGDSSGLPRLSADKG